MSGKGTTFTAVTLTSGAVSGPGPNSLSFLTCFLRLNEGKNLPRSFLELFYSLILDDPLINPENFLINLDNTLNPLILTPNL